MTGEERRKRLIEKIINKLDSRYVTVDVLLLKDLCARLPYGLICKFTDTFDGCEVNNTLHPEDINELFRHKLDCKPYLRPMSSMTEEEVKILEDFGVTISPFSGQIRVPFDEIEFPFITMQKIISYLYSIHIDINGLIPKGLAIEVDEENNPYED